MPSFSAVLTRSPSNPETENMASLLSSASTASALFFRFFSAPVSIFPFLNLQSHTRVYSDPSFSITAARLMLFVDSPAIHHPPTALQSKFSLR